MKVSIFFTFLFAVLLMCFSCNVSRERDVSPQSKKENTVSVLIDSIQSSAASFAPQIGKYGGTVYLPLFEEPRSFNPLTHTRAAAHMYEGLVRINGVSAAVEPCLAAEWAVSGDSLQWTFIMRKDARWSDGMPVSAYDVVFTFNDLIYNSESSNMSKERFIVQGKRMEIRALDSTRVVFTLAAPYAPFLHCMSQEILPAHAYKRMMHTQGVSSFLNSKTPLNAMTGSGPFKLVSYAPLYSLTFVRNPYYWREDSEGNRLPYIDTVVYIIMADLNDAVHCLKRQEIDYLPLEGNDVSLAQALDSVFSFYHLGPSLSGNVTAFNLNRGKNTATGMPYVDSVKQKWFGNTAFRKAVAHAINRTAIIDSLFAAAAYPQWSVLSPAARYFYNPEVKQYPYDKKYADSILAREGFVDRDGDGFREDNDGNILAFSLFYTDANFLRKQMAVMIGKELVELGMRVTLHPVEQAMLSEKLTRPPYAWDMVLVGLEGGIEPHFGRHIWHSSGQLHFWSPKQETPVAAWQFKIDSLFETGSSLWNQQKRKIVYNQWQRIVSEQLPVIPVVHSKRVVAIAKRIKNVNPSIPGGVLHTIEQLYIEE